MSNSEVITLPLLEVEPHQVTEVLRCVMHTILFNRALGQVRPREIDSELFDVTYVNCGDPEVDAKIEARISEFSLHAEKRLGEVSQLYLSFFEKRKRQVGWFGKQDERMCWEQWYINIRVISPPDLYSQEPNCLAVSNVKLQRQAKLQSAIEEMLMLIVRTVNDRKDHIPPVTSSSLVTYPFDVHMDVGSSRFLPLNTMKRMLLQATPPTMLN